MMLIWGDRDGLLTPARLADAKAMLPANTQYVQLPGGNHQGFALYSHQFFDNPAQMSQADQIDFANERTAAFFARNF